MSEGQPPTPPQQGLPPISQPFPGSLTPGWNDPPSIQYNPAPSGTPGRTKLNKRVPFPLQQSNVTTKPTAIVQPCQAPMHPISMGQQSMGITSNTSNIAVVHPLQHTNPAVTAPILPQPAAVGLATVSGGGTFFDPPTSTRRESNSPNHAQAQSDAAVPTMFVPAVPRQPDAPTQSSVQHL